MATFGFIGIGNMGGAIAVAASKAHDPADIWVSAGHPEKAAEFAARHGMAASTKEQIANLVGGGYPVIRIMPNTPARIGQGVIQYDWNDRCQRSDVEQFLSVLGAAGHVSHLPERLIDAGSAVSGSGPAFAAMFIEAMADGGVICGLPRQTAMEYAARTLIGTAELMLQSGDHPGKMKDAVCSPGGSTIQGVRALEKGGFRSAVTEAVVATWEKNKEFAK